MPGCTRPASCLSNTSNRTGLHFYGIVIHITPTFSFSRFDGSLLEEPQQLALRWMGEYQAPIGNTDLDNFSANQICAFLDRLLDAGILSAVQLSAMDEVSE